MSGRLWPKLVWIALVLAVHTGSMLGLLYLFERLGYWWRGGY